MRVEWLHNNSKDRSSGSFMWDIYDRLIAMTDLNLVLVSIPVIRRPGDLSQLVSVQGRKHGDVLLHGQFGSFVGLMTGWKRATRRIISLRGSDAYWRYGGLSDRIGGLLRVLMSWLGCLRCDAIVVMSHAMALRVRRWPFMGRRPVHVLVDPSGALFWPEAAVSIAAQLRDHSFTVLMASLAERNPIKRLDVVADAIELCQKTGMALRLNAISGMTRESVRDAIAVADSVALASTHEGWPNIIKEALLLGRPFVATPVSDLADWAGPGEANRIVAAHPLDFAMAWVDQIAAEVLKPMGISPALAQFHPDVCALKHALLYRCYGDASS